MSVPSCDSYFPLWPLVNEVDTLVNCYTFPQLWSSHLVTFIHQLKSLFVLSFRALFVLSCQSLQWVWWCFSERNTRTSDKSKSDGCHLKLLHLRSVCYWMVMHMHQLAQVFGSARFHSVSWQMSRNRAGFMLPKSCCHVYLQYMFKAVVTVELLLSVQFVSPSFSNKTCCICSFSTAPYVLILQNDVCLLPNNEHVWMEKLLDVCFSRIRLYIVCTVQLCLYN